MLLLVTILLVVVGTISLVIGFVQSSLLPIYISIACSVLAAVVLLIFSRMTAKSQQVVTSGGPAPLDTDRDQADRTQPVPAFAGTGLLERSSSDQDFQPEDRYGSGSGSHYDDVADDDDDLVDTPPPDTVDDDFPIERYDSRRVGEILPLLAELDLDELDIVREHEEQGKARATVLARIDQLIDQLEAEDRQEAASRFDDEPARTSSFAPAAVDEPEDDDELELVDTSRGVDEEPPPIAAAPPAPTVTVGALPEDDDFFPIEDYEELRASEILPLLPELDDDELVMVRDRERATAARSSILRRIDVLLEEPEPAAAAAPPPAPEPEPEPEPVPSAVGAGDGFTTKVPAKRAAAAKKATKAAPAKKAGSKKAAALPSVPVPPKKAAAAKKAPVTKSRVLEKSGTITKVSARKASVPADTPLAKKSSIKAAPAKATVAKKSPAAAAKATAAKSSTKAAKTTRKATKG